MDTNFLIETTKKLVAKPKGILAIDESNETCGKRFEKLGIENTEENRRSYRELLITTPSIEQYVSGMILFEETLRQKTKDGKLFTQVFKDKGIEVGIKVDKGVKDLALHGEEKITEGLDGLRERLAEYKTLGASFAKWRAVFTITDFTPSQVAIDENVHALARYAALAQEAGIVPIVEPEVLMEGAHSIEKDYEVISKILDALFHALVEENVLLEGLILKTGMVVPGTEAEHQAEAGEIAEKTLALLRTHVPEIIGGIVFLSGGQGEDEATANLNEMHKHGPLPWPLTFSYGRAIQRPALEIWSRDLVNNIPEAQEALLKYAKADSEATLGEYQTN